MEARQKEVIEDILKLLKNADEHVLSFRNQVENKNLIIFIGLTKSGKSTLVNYITGFPLVAFKNGLNYKIDCTEASNIGHLSISKTKIPAVIELKGKSDTLIIDAPGFDDNRGSLQEITNALYINQIKYARSVRFVLVCDINSILNDNINYFLNFLKTVETILPHFNKLKECVSVIFTKDNENFSIDHISELLRHKILDFPDLNCKKALVEYLVNHVEVIGSFKMPSEAGPLSEEVNLNINEAISNSNAAMLEESQIKLGISDKAQIVLYDAYLQFHDLVNFISNKLDRCVAATFRRLSALDSDTLMLMSMSNLDASLVVLNSFHASVKKDYVVESIEGIPHAMRELFCKRVDYVCNELKLINRQLISDVDYVFDETTVEAISKKIEYLQCLEVVLEHHNVSDNILKVYYRCIDDMTRKIKDLVGNVTKENTVRYNILKKLLIILEIGKVVKDINEYYLKGSTNGELLRMEKQVSLIANDLKSILSQIMKRPTLKEEIQPMIPLIEGLILICKAKTIIIKKFTTEIIARNKYFHKTNIPFAMCLTGFGVLTYKESMFAVPMVMMLAWYEWKVRLVQSTLTTCLMRCMQRRIFSRGTILDTCNSLFSN